MTDMTNVATPITPWVATEEQWDRLKKMAEWLRAKPNRTDFRMASFSNGDGRVYLDDMECTKESICGTAGCIVGHAPQVFSEWFFTPSVLARCSHMGWIDWLKVSNEIFGGYEKIGFDNTSDGIIWAWMFDSYWDDIDGTPLGGAKRIEHIIKHKTPPQFYIDYKQGKMKPDTAYEELRDTYNEWIKNS